MEYTSDSQPKNEKQLLSFSAAFFFTFTLFVFAPAELYLTNVSDIYISMKTLAISCLPLAVAVFALLLVLCGMTKGKAHIAAVNIVFGLGLAFYVQGNFLQINAALLDGTQTDYSIGSKIINLMIWAAVAAVPWLMFKLNNPVYMKFVSGVSLGIVFVEVITICAIAIGNTLNNRINDNHNDPGADQWYYTITDSFTYSSDKNYIIVLTDQYDSSCFDYALEKYPEAEKSFGGFTYYSDTLGMYYSTSFAVPHIFTGEYNDDKNYPFTYKNTDVFDTLKDSGYNISVYGCMELFPHEMALEFFSNYVKRKPYTFNDYASVARVMYKLVMYKYSPEIAKNLFWFYMTDFNSEISKYSNIPEYLHSTDYFPDNLDFYNSLDNEIVLTDQPQFKLIYLNGLHRPLNLNANLEKDESGNVTFEEQAIAVNKILEKYLNVLRENNIYDNSEIVILADHGSYGDRKNPLLMVKRRNETRTDLKISYAPVSYDDVYPALLSMAGKNGENIPVFDIDENAERTRYFAYTDEYVTGRAKP